jgi:hypothetical protein
LVLSIAPLIIILPYTKTFPYSDDWGYLGPGSLQWFFSQHVDHRIPVQKAIHLLTLYLGHFDFRSLVALNLIIAAVTSALFLVAASDYRGRSSIGDIIFPLCLLSFGAGYTEWGFEFANLCSSLWCAAFLVLMIKYDRDPSPACFVGGATMLFLLAWSGLAGVIVSTIISVALAVFLPFARYRLGIWEALMLGVTIGSNFAIWALWTPSPAAGGQFDLARFAYFAVSMINGPLFVYSFEHTTWKLAALIFMIVAGGILAALRVWRTRNLADFSVAAAGAANLALVAATAYGRSKQMEWQPVLVIHYGILAIPLVLTAWIALSSNVGRKVEIGVGAALLLLFAVAYKANYDWRIGSDSQENPGRVGAALAIAGNDDPAEVAARYINQFMYMDTEPFRQSVAAAIPKLRKRMN